MTAGQQKSAAMNRSAIPCRRGHVGFWAAKKRRRTDGTLCAGPACLACSRERGKAKRRARGLRLRKAIHADEANTSKLACLNGHIGQWKQYRRAKNERRECVECRREANKCSSYGLTRTELKQLYAAAAGRCAACGLSKKLYVDHCHATGRVRGLLCNQCNLTAGHIESETGRLVSLYLKNSLGDDDV